MRVGWYEQSLGWLGVGIERFDNELQPSMRLPLPCTDDARPGERKSKKDGTLGQRHQLLTSDGAIGLDEMVDA